MPDKSAPELSGGLAAVMPLNGYQRAFGDTMLEEVGGHALVSLACPHGGDDALERALKAGLGLSRPAPGSSGTGKNGSRLIWSSPDQMLLWFAHDGPDGADVVAELIGDAAYLTDQTDNWCALSVAGPRARQALERICPIDLHADAFAVDAAARTVMEHLGVFIMRTGADDFLLLSASSSAGSFLHAVEVSLINVG